MTCFFRHLRQLFDKAGLTITKENRKHVDRVIHGIVGVDYKNCSAKWRAVKERLAEDEAAFIRTLRHSLSI
jgi:hypothetical protein